MKKNNKGSFDMNGVLIVNKASGYTSRDVVNIISKKFNTKKVGHTGTLDPIATGVLVVCMGNALKIIELMNNEDKEYIAKIRYFRYYGKNFKRGKSRKYIN